MDAAMFQIDAATRLLIEYFARVQQPAVLLLALSTLECDNTYWGSSVSFNAFMTPKVAASSSFAKEDWQSFVGQRYAQLDESPR
jgi:hypothetical protein